MHFFRVSFCWDEGDDAGGTVPAPRFSQVQANGLNSDVNKSDREKLKRMLEDMFEESDIWLVEESLPRT